MSPLLSELLVRPLTSTPGVEVHVAAGDGAEVRDQLRAVAPDWVIAELRDEGFPGEWADLFGLTPRLKMVALAEHGERTLVCVQLGQLSPSELVRTLGRIDVKDWADGGR
jgi:hypothetical protein